jgi:hypothetical protein
MVAPPAAAARLAALSIGFISPPGDAATHRDLVRFILAVKRTKLFKRADFATLDLIYGSLISTINTQ